MWMLAHLPPNHGGSNAHAQWFSCWKNGADDHYIIMWCHENLSCWKREGTIKGEHDQTWGLLLLPSSGSLVQEFGFLNKPQTLYLGCISALQGGSITRMDIATYLSIYMCPDFSGGLLVSTTLVVWQQLGRSLPSPPNPVSSEAWITTLQQWIVRAG